MTDPKDTKSSSDTNLLEYADLPIPQLFIAVEERLRTDPPNTPFEIRKLMFPLQRVMDWHKSSDRQRFKAKDLYLALDALLMEYIEKNYKGPFKEISQLQATKNAAKYADADLLLVEGKNITIDRSTVIGSGRFGTVYAGKVSGVPVAIKELKPGQSKDLFVYESYILSGINHPYCVEYVGHMESPFRIITRRYATDLKHLISSHSLEMHDRFRVAYQLTAALHYIHSIGLVHRDLKPDNIFIDMDGNVKLADFGLAQRILKEDSVRDSRGQPVGNKLYMSPEQLLGLPFSQEADVYSLGVILWAIFTGKQPFEGVTCEEELMNRQKAKPMLPIPECSTIVGDDKPPKKIFDCAEKCYSSKRPELYKVMNRIRDIGVRYVIHHSGSAEDFWKDKVCYGTYRHHVTFSHFVTAVYDELKGSHNPKLMINDVEHTSDDIAANLIAAVPRSFKMMDIDHFWCLCCWFPNFFNNLSAYKNMLTIINSEWYCKEESVLCRLKSSECDAFVIRPSTSSPFSYPFVLCVKSGKDFKFYHIRRKITEGIFSTDLTGEVKSISIIAFANMVCKNLLPVASTAANPYDDSEQRDD